MILIISIWLYLSAPLKAMAIRKFSLINFRNYERENIQFTPGINVLIGKNGQGKTNVLEGLYFLLTGKSYRVQRESEMVRWGEKEFDLYGEFALSRHSIRLESHFQEKRKAMLINGVPCRKLSDYLGTVNVIFFSPDDLILVKGGPRERRIFLDLHIAQLLPHYIGHLNDYNKLLMQKNALLKSLLNKKEKREQLALWNEQLLLYGEKIIRTRFAYLSQLSRNAGKIYQSLSAKTEEIDISYFSAGKLEVEQALENFSELLKAKAEEEIEKQMILVGPQRDDLKITLNGRSARQYASQGQQRSIVLSLKLAQLEVMQVEKSEYPLLLLDDVLSELDQLRREYLMYYIRQFRIQSIITVTSAEAEKDIEASSLYEVNQGKIRRKS